MMCERCECRACVLRRTDGRVACVRMQNAFRCGHVKSQVLEPLHSFTLSLLLALLLDAFRSKRTAFEV